MYSDQKLVKLCQQNNAKAQRELYEKYKSRLMGLSVRYTKLREEAEDVFQEAYVKIFKNIKQLQKVESLEKWMKQTLVNTAINYYHKHKRHKGHVDYEVVQIANADYEKIIGRLANDELLTVINRLPEGYKMVFNLYVIENYNHKEIGEMLKISENTSKSQLSRAKVFLKKELENLGIKKFERDV